MIALKAALHDPQHNDQVFFLNSNSLSNAFQSTEYRQALWSSSYVFPDGIALRTLARLEGVRICDNLPGTDLVPSFLSDKRVPGGSCYLLGGTPRASKKAAARFVELFPRWKLAGFCHGYFRESDSDAVIAQINSVQPELLLVGMGTPLQEIWLSEHQGRLNVPLSIAVGGLFDYWAGSIRRAPVSIRRLNLEWLWILFQQRHKWPRYSVNLVTLLRNMHAQRRSQESQ